jgi:hypothetical protein
LRLCAASSQGTARLILLRCPNSQPCGRIALGIEENVMPKYVIEREIPGAGKMSPEQLQAVSQTSCGVLRQMGPEIQWVHSYVTDDKIYCIYIAPDEAMIREHATRGGFPANKISKIKTIIDPTTAG